MARKTYVEEALDRWRARSLISPDQWRRLKEDLTTEAEDRGGAVMPALAAVSVGFGLMTLIAANWAGLPALMRIILVMALTSGFVFTSGAFLHHQKRIAGEACAAIGTLLFGGVIVAIGQAYHVGGTTEGFLAFWVLGAVLTTVFSNARAAGCVAGALTALWVLATWHGTMTSTSLALGGISVAVMGALAIVRRSVAMAQVTAAAGVIWIAAAVWRVATPIKLFHSQGPYVVLILVGIYGVIAVAAEGLRRPEKQFGLRTLTAWSAWSALACASTLATMWADEAAAWAVDLGLLVIGGALAAYGRAESRPILTACGAVGYLYGVAHMAWGVDHMLLAGFILILLGCGIAAILSLAHRSAASATREVTAS